MQSIIFIQSVDGFNEGQVALVENNVAHRYIDTGKAKKAGHLDYSDRMVGSQSSKVKIRTKNVKPRSIRPSIT